MKRAIDVVLAIIVGLIVLFPCLAIAMLVRATSLGPALHWSDRIGRNNVIFRMPKFRSMYVGTPAVATHLLSDAHSHITPLGRLLRTTSLDELPQLWSVLKGDMSFVGPRPALYNQHDLAAIRTAIGVHRLRPGITGWAQINGRDELPIKAKANLDAYYLANQSMLLDARILLLTVWRVLQQRDVQH